MNRIAESRPLADGYYPNRALLHSLAFCPNCGKVVSPQAIACPNCGHPLNQPQPIVKQAGRVEKPTAAFVLSLVGGIFTLVLGSTAGTTFTIVLFGLAGGPLFLIIGRVCGALIIVGAALQYSSNQSRVTTGSVLVLAFAVIAIPFTFFGLIIGFVLSLVGAILGLRWKPTVSEASTASR